ncbi:M56 family metallopeptidase [Sphingomonas sp. GC_Shp_1]|uniref:M56 family metallopeptidase n=1 Tax=unclassified Sphingomonas TaxID=196159 RepID=UPI00226ABD22
MLTAFLIATTQDRGDIAEPQILTRLARVAEPEHWALAVAAMLLVLTAGILLRLIRLVRGTAHVVAMIRAAGATLSEDLTTAANPQRVPIRVSTAAATPMLAGWLRPVILMPERLIDRLSTVQLRLICEHEFTHARRRDNIQAWLEAAAAALFWWCPASRLARRRIGHARETSCDAAVLQHADSATRRTYAMTLLHVLGHPLPLAIGYAHRDVAERVRSVLAPRATFRRPGGLLPQTVMMLTITVPPVATSAIATRAGTIVAMARPFDVRVAPIGRRDQRTGRPLYQVTYRRPRDTTDVLLGRLPDAQLSPARLRRQRDGSWQVTLD